MEEENKLIKAYEKYKAEGGLLSQNEIENYLHSWELLLLKIGIVKLPSSIDLTEGRDNDK